MALREWARLQDLTYEPYLPIPDSAGWPLRMLLQQGGLIKSDVGVKYKPPLRFQRYLFARMYRGPKPPPANCAMCGRRTTTKFSASHMFYISLLGDWKQNLLLPESSFLCDDAQQSRSDSDEGERHSCARIFRCCFPAPNKLSFLKKFEEFAVLALQEKHAYQNIGQNSNLEYHAIGDLYRLLHGRQMTDFMTDKPNFVTHFISGDWAWLGVIEHSALLAERGDCSPIRHHTNTIGNAFKALHDVIKEDIDSRVDSGQILPEDRLDHERREWSNISCHVRCRPDQFRVGPGPGAEEREKSWDLQCKMLELCQPSYLAGTTNAAKDAKVDLETATSTQYAQFHQAGKAAVPSSYLKQALDATVISSITGYELKLTSAEKKRILVWEHRHAKMGLPTRLRPLTIGKVNPPLHGPDRIVADVAAKGGNEEDMERALDEVIERVIVCSAEDYVDPFAELVDTVLAHNPDYYYSAKEFFLHSDATKLHIDSHPIYTVARQNREALRQRDPTAEIRRLESLARRNPALGVYDASPERLASLRHWSAKDTILPIPTLMQVDEFRIKHTKSVSCLELLLFFGLEDVQKAGIALRKKEEKMRGRG
ncbi:hypothetical protein BT96DRAFT_498418 [Gymnopus androsaceus JB14]|uniref:Uncharacterized protein n=1 Tax=Gymnopus androsaceus JB14 TaxID=1447944 RepID=A0A6A4HYU4_9AGAR|nr:hypothetical protein BT96DRAFT_498418 [Gymnopus androsaceus JB14]